MNRTLITGSKAIPDLFTPVHFRMGDVRLRDISCSAAYHATSSISSFGEGSPADAVTYSASPSPPATWAGRPESA